MKIYKKIIFILICFIGVYLGCVYATTMEVKEDVISSTLADRSDYERSIKGFAVIDLYDLEGMPSYKEFLDDKNSLNKLKKFYNDINNEFTLIELYFQHLEQLTYYNNDKKFADFGSPEDLTNQVVTINGKETYVTPLKAVQIGENTFRLLFSNDNIFDGRAFNKSDFVYKGIIPIILGYEYLEIYELGDVIELNYLGKTSKFEVIGFFKPNTSIILNIDEFNLNQYICSPFFNIIEEPTNREEELFQLKYYLQKSQGYIQNSDKYTPREQVFNKKKNILEAICIKNDIKYGLTESENVITITD